MDDRIPGGETGSRPPALAGPWFRFFALSLVGLFLLADCTASRQGRSAVSEQNHDHLRRRMVAEQLQARDIKDARVLKAMGNVPRHEFVPDELRQFAYEDRPLPIGLDQTISQPYIVALMTQLARPQPGDRALEVGTGSGYQAAVLADLGVEVYTIEIIEALAERATSTLRRLGYDNVRCRAGDGYLGWPEFAPFDSILVTAAAPRIPQPLLDQLADGGRLVIPVGGTFDIQVLRVVQREGERFRSEDVTAVRFVPMTGEVQRPPIWD